MVCAAPGAVIASRSHFLPRRHSYVAATPRSSFFTSLRMGNA